MHHGTIMFDSNLDLVAQALHVDQEKIRAKGIASVRSRVTTVRRHMASPVTLEEFRSLLLREILEQQPGDEYVFTEEDKAQIAQLRAERYATWEWNYGPVARLRDAQAAALPRLRQRRGAPDDRPRCDSGPSLHGRLFQRR